MIIAANAKTTEENNESASSQLRHKLTQFHLRYVAIQYIC